MTLKIIMLVTALITIKMMNPYEDLPWIADNGLVSTSTVPMEHLKEQP